MLKKRESNISKVKSKYWIQSHNFVIRLTKMVEEAKRLEQQNGNHLWWEAISKGNKNVRIHFNVFDGEVNYLKGYQFVEFHIIFYIKIGEIFRRKSRMLAGGHMTVSTSPITYSSVVLRDSVRIDLNITALNGLSILGCNI